MKRKDGAVLFWRPEQSGYTYNVEEAGRYTKEETDMYHKEDRRDDPRVLEELVLPLMKKCVIDNSKLGSIVKNTPKNRKALNILLKQLLNIDTGWTKECFIDPEEYIKRNSNIIKVSEDVENYING